MKLLQILAILLVIFFAGVLTLALLTSPETSVEADITIGAPQAVIANIVNDVHHYPQWCPNILNSKALENEQHRQVTYQLDDERLALIENVQIEPTSKKVTFTQVQSDEKRLIQNLNQQIQLTGLPDGTTDVHWRVDYTIDFIFSRIINRFTIKPKFESALNANLRSLKQQIES